MLAGGRRRRRRPAVSRARAVRGGHADRQPGRHHPARGARARAGRRDRLRGHPPQRALLHHLGLTSRCSRCTSTTSAAAQPRCCSAWRAASAWPTSATPARRPCGTPARRWCGGARRRLSRRADPGRQQRGRRALRGRRHARRAASRSSASCRTRRRARAGARRAAPARRRPQVRARGAAPHRRRWPTALGEACAERAADRLPRADQAVRDAWPRCLRAISGLARRRRASHARRIRARAACAARGRTPSRSDAPATMRLAPLLAELPLKQAVALAASSPARRATLCTRGPHEALKRRDALRPAVTVTGVP